ncbi:hypothetical protein SAMD00023353_7800100 [Rosellinia necatrix]|uniref:Uncharacterized protein n=1 Tax=Rosellinia necatrix TaxID=77044 RepID=A0A1W2TUK2_ROSNE|nr:hypothetical protein SAMD00023353_7800100 [Rosellinia necatrix]
MTVPIFLSPALPSELLSYILNHHVYPTTLIICSSQADFIASAVDDMRQQSRGNTPSADLREPFEGEPTHHHGPSGEDGKVKHALLSSSPLCQVAISRHIRIIYVPTVTHLRAYLTVFSPDDSRVPIPPTFALAGEKRAHIILYGFLKLHRDTSEWSAQGLSNTTSTLVELTQRLCWTALLIEPRSGGRALALEELLKEAVPILNGGARRLGPDPEEGVWTGRTVEVGRIMGRWARFQRAPWDVDGYHE